MIEQPNNGVSHPKYDLLKKYDPPNIFFKFNKYNDRKCTKLGKQPQKLPIKNDPAIF